MCSANQTRKLGFWLGQVVYILDQVRAMEKEMIKNIKQQGLDIEPQIVVVNGLNSVVFVRDLGVVLLLW